MGPTKIALLGKNCAENRTVLDEYLPRSEWEAGVWLPGDPDEVLFDMAKDVEVMVPAGDVLMSRRLFPAKSPNARPRLICGSFQSPVAAGRHPTRWHGWEPERISADCWLNPTTWFWRAV
jgi:hypothetical protein